MMVPKLPFHIAPVLRRSCLLLFLGPVLMAGQGTIEVDGTVREKETNRKIPGVEVKVTRGAQAYDAVSTLSNGKYSLSLDHGSDYALLFTFGDMSPRKVLLNTSSIPEEFRTRPFYLTVEMSLFEVPAGFDRDLLDEPIGKVSFDPAKEQLSWDLDYTAMMQARIDEELASASGDGGAADDAEYAEHMRKAEVEFGRERWAQSISWLERALSVKPGDARAEGMMADAQERMGAAEEAAAALREYEALMREGKLAMRKEDFAAASSNFNAALVLFPDEQEPKDLLAQIGSADAAAAQEAPDNSDADFDAAMAEGSSALGGGDLDRAQAAFERASAIKPAEREPKQKLAQIRGLRNDAARETAASDRMRERYDEVIQRADRDFDNQDYVRAKSGYEEASALLPSETYPRERAQEAAGRIVELGQEEQEASPPADRAQRNESDREYEDRVREGDEAFDAERWEEAKLAYAAALILRPEERYPRNRMRRLEALLGGTEELSSDMEVDRQALLSEGLADEAASLAEMEALRAEQARILEEERLAAKAEQDRRSSDNQARQASVLDRSRNYVLAIQDAAEDDAELYYRNALEAEINARGQAVYARAEGQARLNAIWVGNSDARRQSTYMEMEERQSEWANAEFEASSYRADRMADFSSTTTDRAEREKDWLAQGNAGRRDRLITLRDREQDNRAALFDRTKRYAVFVDSLDRMLTLYADFNRDLRRASIDSRIMRFEEIERRAARHRKVGEGSEIRRLGHWTDVQKKEREGEQSRQLASGEASIRAATALRMAFEKDPGHPPTPEDYKEVPAKEGIRQGVEERSYEEGNALIVERTVRVDNEVNVYRKTVAKHGVYYFKNNQSITRDIWVLETFEISD